MNDCNRCKNWWKCSELTRQKMIAKGDCDEYIQEDETVLGDRNWT